MNSEPKQPEVVEAESKELTHEEKRFNMEIQLARQGEWRRSTSYVNLGSQLEELKQVNIKALEYAFQQEMIQAEKGEWDSRGSSFSIDDRDAAIQDYLRSKYHILSKINWEKSIENNAARRARKEEEDKKKLEQRMAEMKKAYEQEMNLATAGIWEEKNSYFANTSRGHGWSPSKEEAQKVAYSNFIRDAYFEARERNSRLERENQLFPGKKKVLNILGLNENATGGEIGEAYRKYARNHHPDKHPGGVDPKVEENLKTLTQYFAPKVTPGEK